MVLSVPHPVENFEVVKWLRFLNEVAQKMHICTQKMHLFSLKKYEECNDEYCVDCCISWNIFKKRERIGRSFESSWGAYFEGIATVTWRYNIYPLMRSCAFPCKLKWLKHSCFPSFNVHDFCSLDLWSGNFESGERRSRYSLLSHVPMLYIRMLVFFVGSHACAEN